jgi:Tol biopolymer transport system component/tRNA A-37 threonylcarbamoyl transferase component Bud32
VTDPERRQRVEALCEAALERDACDRAAFLETACGDDAALRQQVAALLAHAQAAEAFLEAPLGAVAANVLDGQGGTLVGRHIGSCAALSLIGAGAMGEIYRARDLKLGRDVAIKVLSPWLLSDPERQSRLEREARLLAALNHPNIATIHGFEESDGVRGFVMELVEGVTLAERIAGAATGEVVSQREFDGVSGVFLAGMPLKEALEIARQIAGALDAAHQKGIVHRDLKPANIKLTPDGMVKVLDFGLATAFPTQRSGVDLSEALPTSIDGKLGMLVGTPAFMSPEQARGETVDKRTDIWAFGCVLYEMLTARPAFSGETISETIAAVLEREPDWEALPATTPEPIRRLLRRCLEKNPKRRLRDIGDARLDIDEASASRTALPQAQEPRARAQTWRIGLGTLTTGAVVAGLAVAIFPRDPVSPPPPYGTVSTTIELPPAAPLALGVQIPQIGFEGPILALSPDSSSLVYVGQTSSGTMLYLRDLASERVLPLRGTDGAIFPFFSPDGRWVGFLTNDKVKKVQLDGDGPITLCDARVPVRATWTDENTIYFQEDQGYRLSRVSAEGGPAVPVTTSMRVAGFSQALPGGGFLASVPGRGINRDYADVVLVSPGGDTKVVLSSGYDPHYVPPGYLVFGRGGNLLSVPFDPGTGRVEGAPTTIAAGVSMDSTLRGVVHASASNNGVIAYVPGGNRSIGRLAWVDRQGHVEYLPTPPRVYGVLELTPGGDRVAVHVGDVTDYVWIYDLVRREARRLPAGESSGWPIWNPDGRTITHAAWRSAGAIGESVVAQASDGSGAVRQILAGLPDAVVPESWTPDGQVLAVRLVGEGLRRGLVTADGRLERIPTKDIEQFGSDFSPDGRWLAFTSNDTGQFEIYVQSFPDRQTIRQISTGGGMEPRWCRCGELFYRAGNQWMSVRIRTHPELQWDPPRLAFQTDFVDSLGRSYDISPDGKRLLVVKRAEPETRSRINVVINWPNLLTH